MPPKSKAKANTTTNSTTTNATTNNIVLELTFPNIEIMAHALSRFSCYIEDPNYAGVPFSLQAWKGVDVPSKRYAGHNFPLSRFDECLPKLGKLNEVEKVVVRAIQEFSRNIKPRTCGYIIAYAGDDAATGTHEKQHAAFYYNPEFQARTEGVWNSVCNTYPAWAEQFKDHLSKMYCERVHIDEFQAIIGNREYECVQKIQQLVTSIVPKPENFGYTIVKVVLPKELPDPAVGDDDGGYY